MCKQQASGKYGTERRRRIENTRKRLDLLFGDNYQLDIQDQDDTYNVRLQFPIQPINTANA